MSISPSSFRSLSAGEGLVRFCHGDGSHDSRFLDLCQPDHPVNELRCRFL